MGSCPEISEDRADQTEFSSRLLRDVVPVDDRCNALQQCRRCVAIIEDRAALDTDEHQRLSRFRSARGCPPRISQPERAPPVVCRRIEPTTR